LFNTLGKEYLAEIDGWAEAIVLVEFPRHFMYIGSTTMIEIEGVIPPVITPFSEGGDVDWDAHARNLARWNKERVTGYLVLGSNGETPFLQEAEKIRLIESTVEHAAPGRLIMAGTGLEGTRETTRLTNLAAEHGAHTALILSPCFFRSHMTESALVRHYMTVADSSRIPILLYSVPAYTQLAIPEQVVARVGSHPNVLGMKDSAGDVARLAVLKNLVPSSFQLIVG
jgi:4-hydroxy-2-oxoglutarate aldolase